MTSPRLFWQLLTVLLTLSLNVKSQDNSIYIKSDSNDDQSVDFSYVKSDYGTFLLSLTFTQLGNASPTSFKGEINHENGKFLTIRPINQYSSISYTYSYTYIRGVLNPKIDPAFVYLLPLSKGKKNKVLELSNINEMFLGKIKPNGWKAFEFEVNPGDTVFSARKGLVVEVIDGNEADTTLSYAYKGKSNSILIEHEDGTLAKYDVLKKGSIKVKPGQVVFPHSPLAIAGTYDLASNTQVRFYVYFLSEGNLDQSARPSLATMKNFYAFVNPLFHTTEGDVHLKSTHEYTVDFTEEHILKELSKREKKKLGKKQSSNQFIQVLPSVQNGPG